MEVDWKTAITVPGYEIRPVTLRFTNDDIERHYVVDRLERALTSIRVFLLAGVLLYALFGILDAYVLGDAKNIAWAIRYCGVIPVLLFVFTLTFTQAFLKFSQLALGAAMFAAGLGIIGMTAVASAPGDALYYAGLIMVVSYCLNLIRLRWLYAAVIAVLLTLLYQAVVFWINPIEPYLILSNNFFLVMSTGVGIFSSYVHELFMRRDYLHAEMLKIEKNRSDDLLAEAESASRAKSDFLSMMSHELRTPLNAITGFSEVMQHRLFGPIGSEKYEGYVDDIHSAALHLLNIISDVLDLSKAEMGKLTLTAEAVDLVDSLESCFRLLREQAAEGGVRLSFVKPKQLPLVNADPRLLKQVFINLLGNAIKFTLPGGDVNVFLTEDDARGLVIHFEDSGIGIAEQNLDKVLEPFMQVESAFARRYGGSGLGLPLVKRIMLLHDGDITLHSTLGAGTTVSISLPRARILSGQDGHMKAAE